MSALIDQTRTELAADNCEVLRARLAKYEDAEGRPLQPAADLARRMDQAITDFTSGRACMHVPPFDTDVDIVLSECLKLANALESQTREIERLTQHVEQQDDAYALLSLDAGRKMDELERELAALKQPISDARPLDAMSRFVETVRECYHLASSYSGSLDGVDEHGGDDHEDPICAVFHRLYYALFDGDRALAELRARLGNAVVMPDNLLSHRGSWISALERLVVMEPESAPGEVDDKSYWLHELQAMRDMYTDLDRLKPSRGVPRELLLEAIAVLMLYTRGSASREGILINDLRALMAGGAK